MALPCLNHIGTEYIFYCDLCAYVVQNIIAVALGHGWSRIGSGWLIVLPDCRPAIRCTLFGFGQLNADPTTNNKPATTRLRCAADGQANFFKGCPACRCTGLRVGRQGIKNDRCPSPDVGTRGLPCTVPSGTAPSRYAAHPIVPIRTPSSGLGFVAWGGGLEK